MGKMKYLNRSIILFTQKLYWEFAGVDERVVGIPLSIIDSYTHEFIKKNEFSLEVTEDSNETTNLGLANVDSYFKTLWMSLPVVVEWKLRKLAEDMTKIEIRFKLTRKFRLFYWTILLFLFFIEFVFIYTGKDLFALLPIVPLMLSLLISVRLLSNKNYNRLLRQYYDVIKKNVTGKGKAKCFEDILQVSACFPDMLIVSILFLFGHISIFSLTYDNMFFDFFYLSKESSLFCYIILLLIILLFIVIGVTRYGLKEKLFFVSIGIALNLSCLFLINLPNLKLSPHNILRHGDTIKVLNDFRLYRYLGDIEWLLRKSAILTIFLYIAVFIAGLLIFIAVFNMATKFSEGMKYFHERHSEKSRLYIALTNSNFLRHFSLCIIAFWAIANIGICYGLFNLFALFELSIFGGNYAFPGTVAISFFKSVKYSIFCICYPYLSLQTANVLTKTISLLYVLPFFPLVFLFIKKRLKTSKFNPDDEYDLNTLSDGNRHYLISCVEQISERLEMDMPIIVLTKSDIPGAQADFTGFPYFKKCMFLSKGCLKFSNNELKGLIAHEMFHLKKHSIKWYILNKLSNFTLFGTGFLACTVSSYQLEFEADEFAWKYLKEGKADLKEYENALRLIEISQRFKRKVIEKNGSLLFLNGKDDNKIDNKKKLKYLQRINMNIKIFSELYFGDEILSYIHPTIEDRMANLRKLSEGKVEFK
ncbi:MAG: M48 family metalloprotease [Deltaproteobacteria bacterium]|nr:M48 family metalloprotease [Deltaproteobacteria bacterium]